MLLVYSFLMFISGITDLWIFFRVSQIAASKKNILILGGVLLLLPTICVGIVQLATFLEILFFVFYFRKSKEKTLAIGSILIVGVVDSIIDIITSILGELLSIEDEIYLNLLVTIVVISLTVFIIEIVYKHLHAYLISENRNVFIGLLLYLYVSTTLTTIFYGQTKKVTSLSIFFTIFVLIQVVFAIATYGELMNIQKHLLKKSQQDKLIKEQKQLQDYAEYLEKSEDELRAFRHDYRNMFNSLKISAQEGDTKELIQKLDEYTKANLNAKAFEKYRDVNHIKEISLKQIQQRGYSTKKSHSGMGLANINSIKNRYENMTISYEVPKGYFDFYLVIEPEE